MKISINVPYTKNGIAEIVDYIHFKYFDIQKNEDLYIISYYYPVVEEVMKEIYYSFLFNNKNFYDKLLSYKLINGGGLGPCFEQIVVCNLTPPKSGYNRLIPNLLINKKETIPHFIPRIDEVNIPYIEKKIKLESNNIYLIDQKVFGGKSLDFIIIDCKKEKQIIYSFQASTLKETIFEEEEIKRNLKEMNEYITKHFFQNLKVDKNNLYFGYIFSKINEKDSKFKTMINNCNRYHIPYSFFDHKNNIFTKKDNSDIKNINDLVYNPFIIEPFLTFKNDILHAKRCISLTKLPHFQINEEIEKKVINILKMIYHKEITILEFQECLEKQYIFYFYYDFYLTKDNKGNSFIVICFNDKFNVYSLDNIINNNNSFRDYLLDDKCLYDCYFIYSEGEKKKEPLYYEREKFLTELKVPPEDNKKERI